MDGLAKPLLKTNGLDEFMNPKKIGIWIKIYVEQHPGSEQVFYTKIFLGSKQDSMMLHTFISWNFIMKVDDFIHIS